MIPPKRTYYSKFVFSLKAILPDLEDDVRLVKEDLAKQGHRVTDEQIISAWVMFQLERHLYLHLRCQGQHAETYRLLAIIGTPFFYRHESARELLLAQIRPTLTHHESVPYTDRVCSVEIRLPDLQLNFL